MNQLNETQARAFHDSKAWEKMTFRERACFQINQKLLCMPFREFHEAVEKTIGRPVYTHEFGLNMEGLKRELDGTGSAPTLADIIAMLPTEKTIVVVEQGEDNDNSGSPNGCKDKGA
jgi:hypothetical protein